MTEETPESKISDSTDGESTTTKRSLGKRTLIKSTPAESATIPNPPPKPVRREKIIQSQQEVSTFPEAAEQISQDVGINTDQEQEDFDVTALIIDSLAAAAAIAFAVLLIQDMLPHL